MEETTISPSKKQSNWLKIIYTIGVAAVLIGTVDPMEGSILITVGILLIAIASFRRKDRHLKIFIVSMLLIFIGVFFLFYLSSLGGIGGNSGRSMWWGLLILPYPLGWLILIITLIVRALRKPRLSIDTE